MIAHRKQPNRKMRFSTVFSLLFVCDTLKAFLIKNYLVSFNLFGKKEEDEGGLAKWKIT